MLSNPAIERLPLLLLRALQNARLKERVAYEYGRVPFHRQKFSVLGIDPTTFRGLEGLSKLGFPKKTDFWDNYLFGLCAVSASEVARLHYSSGTTGKATVVRHMAGDLNSFVEVVARSLAAASSTRKHRIHNLFIKVGAEALQGSFTRGKQEQP